MLATNQLSPDGPVFSRLVAGVMTWGVWGHDLTVAQMSNLIDHCLELGITTFDHADIYGHYTTEAAFGQALAQRPDRRQQMELISKCGIKLVGQERPENLLKSYDCSRGYIIKSAEQSLRNLGTDYLDLLLIHRPSPLLHAEEVAEAVALLKASGKVRHFGVSNFTPAQLDYLRQATPIVTNQIEASLLHTQPFFDGTLTQCQQLNIRPMAWSPLGGFFNSDDETTSRVAGKLEELGEKYGNPGADVILLAWLLHHPSGILPVIGTARANRLATAVAALDIQLTDEDWFALLEASRGHEVA